MPQCIDNPRPVYHETRRATALRHRIAGLIKRATVLPIPKTFNFKSCVLSTLALRRSEPVSGLASQRAPTIRGRHWHAALAPGRQHATPRNPPQHGAQMKEIQGSRDICSPVWRYHSSLRQFLSLALRSCISVSVVILVGTVSALECHLAVILKFAVMCSLL